MIVVLFAGLHVRLITESGCFLEKKEGADVVDWTKEHQGVNGKIIRRASRTTTGQSEAL